MVFIICSIPFLQCGQSVGLKFSFSVATSCHVLCSFSHFSCPSSVLAILSSVALFSNGCCLLLFIVICTFCLKSQTAICLIPYFSANQILLNPFFPVTISKVISNALQISNLTLWNRVCEVEDSSYPHLEQRLPCCFFPLPCLPYPHLRHVYPPLHWVYDKLHLTQLDFKSHQLPSISRNARNFHTFPTKNRDRLKLG